MKIAQVVPSLEERHGGPSKSVAGLSAGLARAGHEVTLLTTDPLKESSWSEGNLRIESYPRDRSVRLCASTGLRRRLDAESADLVHHHALWLRTLHYAHRSAVRHRARFVISPRGMMNAWAWRHHRWRKFIAQTLVHPGAFRAVHGWHATSEEEKSDLHALGFRQPICVAPNGVEPPTPAAAADALAHWREACPATAGRPVALFYSRFHRKKRVIELIDSWLASAPKDWLLLLVGIPQEYSVDLLEEYVLRSAGADRIQVFDGTERPAPYAVASLFLLPSHSENFGQSIVEALAHGVPALVTDSTPWAALNQNQSGWCVPWEQFPATLRVATAEGPDRLRERGVGGRNWVLRDYSWDQTARLLTDFYRSLPATAR